MIIQSALNVQGKRTKTLRLYLHVLSYERRLQYFQTFQIFTELPKHGHALNLS